MTSKMRRLKNNMLIMNKKYPIYIYPHKGVGLDDIPSMNVYIQYILSIFDKIQSTPLQCNVTFTRKNMERAWAVSLGLKERNWTKY